MESHYAGPGIWASEDDEEDSDLPYVDLEAAGICVEG